ncbi:FAD-dependent oxidoreductase [Holdemania massiliensis]|uniref:FAD-dependent oxidoreductase n=1 Tax=Holdemania massiliensis TaxID=1468449 RepID=UPI001F06C8D3|nr:FAD-dependent oxidoreductase [Holdemania massiliensis]MCH1940144.1 FAD-dependent oxidoreductase [Holdemania massiliensis]
MKKAFLILCSWMLCFSLTACSAKENTQPTASGTFSATEKGYGGEVEVTLTIENSILTDVMIVGEQETPTVGGQAIEQLPAKMIAANSVEVDGVTGATMTSNAILAAAKNALEVSGMTLVQKEKEVSADITHEDVQSDVLVLGGGLAGLSAAVSAKENGAAHVILLEKLSFLGGCASLSGGVLTRAAQAGDPVGTFDKEQLNNYFNMRTGGHADPKVIQTYVDHSVDDFNWIDSMYETGVEYERFALNPEGLMALRPKQDSAVGAGAQLIGAIASSAEKLGIDVRLSHPVTDLIVDGDQVIGAQVTFDDGSIQNFYADGGIVLATGGFAFSQEALAEYSSSNAEQIVSYASAGTTGDALKWAKEINADIQFGEDWDSCGSFSLAFTGYPTEELFKLVLLNAEGERFINEEAMQPEIYLEMRHQLAQGSSHFYYLTDETMEQENKQWLLDNAGAFVCETLEEVAEKTNMDLETLTQTLRSYNDCAKTGNDPLGKSVAYNLGIEAPYIVIPTDPIRTTTIGGLVTNEKAEVLSADQTVIEGLYAAGEVANYSFFYNVYSCCGSANMDAVVFGRIAGEQAAQWQRAQ